jgi:molybdate transport system substrate-binding protein
MKPKTIFPAKPEEAGILVANGDAEIGVSPFQVLMQVAGIDIVGPLPGDLQDTSVFLAVIMPGVRDAGAAKALTAFLRTPDAAAVIKVNGMELGTP